MRIVRYHEHGGPEVLRVERADPPAPGPGQVRLRAEAIGANYVDTLFRRGTATSGPDRPLPAGLTGDVVGTVAALGPGVTGVAVGDRVAALCDPAVADEVLADAAWLAPVPDGMAPGPASMLPMGAPVALGVLRSGQLAAGETVLVHAAAGGIGHLAVQLAKILGAGTVIGTAGSPAKLDFVRSLGADVAVDYTAPDWPDRVREAAPDGVHVVLDSVGGPTTPAGLDLLAPYGRLVVYGMAGGATPDIAAFGLARRLTYVTGYSLLAHRAARPDQARAAVAELTGHLATGRLRTEVHATLPLAEVAEAHRIMESRQQRGRLLLVP